MIEELDMHLTLVSYISNIWKNKGLESTDTIAEMLQINKVITNKELIDVNLPYISQTEAQSHIKRIIISFHYQNQRALEISNTEEKLRNIQVNAEHAINEVLILLDEEIDSAEQSIEINTQLINLNKEFIDKKIEEDTSYETEFNHSLTTILIELNKENEALTQIIRSIEITMDGIESLLKLQKKEMN